MASRIMASRSSSVPPSTPKRQSSRNNTSRHPSTVGAKKRDNACPYDDYIATKYNADNQLICDNEDDLYLYKSKFDKQYNQYNQGVFCCEKNLMPSTQYDKKKEALYRQYLLHKMKLLDRNDKNFQMFNNTYSQRINKQTLKRRRSMNHTNGPKTKKSQRRKSLNNSNLQRMNTNQPILVNKKTFEEALKKKLSLKTHANSNKSERKNKQNNYNNFNDNSDINWN
jgi:hypothetical protein